MQQYKHLTALIAVLGIVAGLCGSAMAEQQAPVDPLFVPPPPPPTEPVPDWLKFQDPYGGAQKNISGAHRSAEEITAWVANTAADAMTFSPATFNATLTEMKKKFTGNGWLEYATWLRDSQLADMVREQKYGVSTITNGDATILNSGSVAGAYHWIVDVPVIIAFVQNDKNGDQQTISGGKYRLTMQIGRIEKGADDTNVAIEGWKIVTVPK